MARGRFAGRFAATLLATALCASLAGCSYLLGDPYGNYLEKAEAWVDLRAAIKDGSGLSLVRARGFCVDESSTGAYPASYLFFQGDFGDGTTRVGALAYDTLALRSFDVFPNGGRLSAGYDANGDIRIEAETYNAATLLPSMTLPLGGASANAYLVVDGSTSTNYLIYTDPVDPTNLLHLDGYNSSWGLISSFTLQIGSTGESWILARAAVLSDKRLCLLFSSGEGDQTTVIGAVFTDFAAFSAAMAAGVVPVLDAALTGSRMDVFTGGGGASSPEGLSAWITQKGIVYRKYEKNDNNFAFGVYPFGPGGEMSSYTMAANYDIVVYFEPSGKYWYLFDAGPGRFFRMRTWWP